MNQTFNSYYLDERPNDYRYMWFSMTYIDYDFNSYYLEMELGFTNKLLLENEIATKRIKELEEENRKLKEELDKFSDAYKRYRDYEKEELAESCYDLARENEKLKEEIAKLEFDIEAWKKFKAAQEEYIDEDLYDLDC